MLAVNSKQVPARPCREGLVVSLNRVVSTKPGSGAEPGFLYVLEKMGRFRRRILRGGKRPEPAAAGVRVKKLNHFLEKISIRIFRSNCL
jgi:hypothetical protein